MHPAAIITGIGLVTPLGGDVDSTWQALLAGRSIRDHARVADIETFAIDPHSRDPTGRASWPGGADARPVGSRLLSFSDQSRVFRLAHRAAVAAVDESPAPDALVVGTSKGEADAWIANGSIPITGIGNLASRSGDELGIPGPRLTISAACASGLQALIRGILLIAAGDAQRVLVVAAESSLHPMFLENYRRLGVLAPEGAGCRPFDRDRCGFCLSEAAAAVMLESDFTAGDAEERGGGKTNSSLPLRSSASPAVNNSHEPPAGAFPKIAIESYAFGADATHLTGSDPTGRPLRNLLARVVADRQFDLIHAHGTGTVANDPVELNALESVLGNSPESSIADSGLETARHSVPAIYSHKAALGHSLGAAGLVSVVLNVLMHRRGIIPANLNTLHPLPTGCISIRNEIEQRPIRRSLAIAAGFGGAMAAVGLVTIE